MARIVNEKKGRTLPTYQNRYKVYRRIYWSLQYDIETTKNCIFLTGNAGTGKLTFLRCFKEHTKKKTAVLSPTGIAAVNVKGQTIHSFEFGSGAKLFSKFVNPEKQKLFKRLNIIIIERCLCDLSCYVRHYRPVHSWPSYRQAAGILWRRTNGVHRRPKTTPVHCLG